MCQICGAVRPGLAAVASLLHAQQPCKAAAEVKNERASLLMVVLGCSSLAEPQLSMCQICGAV